MVHQEDYDRPHRTIHQFGAGNIHFHGKTFDNHDSEHSHNYSLKSLIRPPIVRQWIHLGKISSEAVASHYAREPALVTAMAFFLVAKFSRVALLIWYSIALPLFRPTFIMQVMFQMFNFFIYLPLLVVRSPAAIITLASLGMATDYLLRRVLLPNC
ncbi:hypothetical protein RSOLAG22IIIB_08688 [Rhizoctonia solani]|uniref:Uncharacterized protein n=1 Tax=Rhizoctonia solani TaxID=456999 RepID=A0A0K6FUN9_9AGAM|nr:hypothetical protein RSOLAG22IIIB_08688 [Rhizoctonia solani]